MDQLIAGHSYNKPSSHLKTEELQHTKDLSGQHTAETSNKLTKWHSGTKLQNQTSETTLTDVSLKIHPFHLKADIGLYEPHKTYDEVFPMAGACRNFLQTAEQILNFCSEVGRMFPWLKLHIPWLKCYLFKFICLKIQPTVQKFYVKELRGFVPGLKVLLSQPQNSISSIPSDHSCPSSITSINGFLLSFELCTWVWLCFDLKEWVRDSALA